MVLLTACLFLSAASSAEPAKPAAPPPPPDVHTGTASPVGLGAISVNGQIHPHGAYTTYLIEYGKTAAYGSTAGPFELAPRLAAYYSESWDENNGAWQSWLKTEHIAEGGAKKGFMRFAEPARDDHNHDDGIGTVHLLKYVYPGPLALSQTLRLGGGDPDLRDAKVSVYTRGNDWVANGSEVMWWTQSSSNVEIPLSDKASEQANWAYSGFSLTEFLRSGKWERVEYRLLNDADQWTYAGNRGTNPHQKPYVYWPINESQRHLNLDFFHMLTYVDLKKPPTGSIDFDEFALVYRNHSLLLPSNGGKLVRSPPGAPDDPARLTDGWRHGPDRMWQCAPNPAGPLEFDYAFDTPVEIQAVQLHQHTEWPAKDVELLVSQDGTSYSPLCKAVVPEKGLPNSNKVLSGPNPNFAFAIETGLKAPARFLRVRIVSGYRIEQWGLGEIEVFGSGANMLPEDELCHVTADLVGLEPGETYHYRYVAIRETAEPGSPDKKSITVIPGEDRQFQLPADARPHVVTGSASRIAATTAKLEGRVTPTGFATRFHFEYGADAGYGAVSEELYAGCQITPRSSFVTLAGLKPGTTYHYRIVAVNEKGKSVGKDAMFTTAGE